MKLSNCKTPSILLITLFIIITAQWPRVASAAPLPPEQQAQKATSNVWQPGLVEYQTGNPIFYKLPEFLANLDKSENQTTYIKVHATLLAATKSDVDAIQSHLPVINDMFAAYLRDLPPDMLNNSKGIFQMRSDLLLRVNKIISPNKIEGVFFEELLTQQEYD